MTGFAGHGPRTVMLAGVVAAGALLLFAIVAAQAHSRIAGASEAAKAAAEELDHVRAVRARRGEVERMWVDPLRQDRALATEGVFGEANEPARVAALRAAAESFSLPALRYAIDPPETVVTSHGLALRRTAMQLEFSATHEGVVPRVLERLAQAGQGRVVARRCHLRRAREPGDGTTFPGVEVDCALDWFTIELRTRGQ